LQSYNLIWPHSRSRRVSRRTTLESCNRIVVLCLPLSCLVADSWDRRNPDRATELPASVRPGDGWFPDL